MDWLGEGEEFLINPRLLGAGTLGGDPECLRRSLPHLPGHIWFFTSGTSQPGILKWVALSKKALLCSSATVNAHLAAHSSDRWLCLLPQFHVAGAQILSRAFLSNSQVITAHWSPQSFTSLVNDNSITLVSLVPQQLYDLVYQKISSPPSLRAVIVGGGTISSQLYEQAMNLGYPVMPSYGLTECSSQVATADLNSPELKLLPHIEARIAPTPNTSENLGCLWLKSDALLTGYALVFNNHSNSSESVQFIDPKIDGWLKTDDLASLREHISTQDAEAGSSFVPILNSPPPMSRKILEIFGRVDETVKISGHLVNVASLRTQLHSMGFDPSCSTIITLADARRENRLVLVLEDKLKCSSNMEKIELFLSSLPSPQRPRDVCWLKELPKTDLGKIKIGELKESVNNVLNSSF